MPRGRSFFRAFYWRAYRDNITGLSAMVAYNLLLSIVPLGLLALFIAGRVLESGDLQESVLADLRRLFPTATDTTLTTQLDRIQNNSTTLGVAALLSSIWIGSSFWGSVDTAFCRIYHVECRSWLRQKAFAMLMLVVVLAFMAATVAIPAVQSIVARGATDLPLGLDEVRTLVYVVTLIAGFVLLFAVMCAIYLVVPNRLVPWRAIWPGALATTVAIHVIDITFPLYLSHVSSLARVGTTIVFILIVLIWFYVVALLILSGAIINSMRFEVFDTGELTGTTAPGSDKEAEHPRAAAPPPGPGEDTSEFPAVEAGEGSRGDGGEAPTRPLPSESPPPRDAD